jgi:Rad3-related DNA helicase
MLKPSDFGILNFENYRPHQLEVATQCYSAEVNGIKYTLANQPCGSGKTLMALTVARQLDEQFTFIAPDISNQYQCLKDFRSLGAELLLGRGNYPCAKHPGYSADICDKKSLMCERCVLAKTGCKPDERMKCTCREVCPYEIQKFKTLMAPISILNPEYFLYEANNVGMFSGRGFVTLDEADTCPDILMSHIELKIPDSMITKYGITHPRFKTKPESWQQWAHETIEIVNDQLSKLNGLFGVEDLREQQKLERLKSKLMFFEREANDNWIYDSDTSVFKPIRVAPYCEQFLWRHAEKFLLMSATLSPMPQLCADLGIDIKDAACYDVPSNFAPEHNPYQNIPFQFSLHVLTKPGAMVEHYSYLADGKDDSRPKFLSELKKALGPKGSIIVYYDAFEKSRLKELAKAFPEYKDWIDSILERIVDLNAPFRDFSYYHQQQLGSASLKHVLPALTDLSYDNMEIGEGTMASLKFMEAAFGNIADGERQKIRTNLLTYCGQDTGGMIEILKMLQGLVE